MRLRTLLLALALVAWVLPAKATVTSTAASVTAQGNGSTTAWPFSFPIPGATSVDQTNVQVTIVDTTVTPALSTILNTTQYSVTGISTPSAPSSSGTVTYPLVGSALVVGKFITIQRLLPLTQTTSLPNQGPFAPKVLETSLDYLTELSQQINGQQSRALQVAVADPGGVPAVLPTSTVRANQFLAFDTNGNPIASPGPSGGTAISTAMIPVVQAGTLALGRTALGLPATSTIAAPFSIYNAPASTPYTVLVPADIGTLFSSVSMGGAGTFNLPVASVAGAGATYGFVRKTNNLTVNRAGSDVIQAIGQTVTTLTLVTDGDMFAIESDGTNWKVISASPNAWNLLTPAGLTTLSVLRSYLAGCMLSNDASNTVLDISACSAADSSNAVMMSLAAFTKSISGAWTAGTGNNGMGQGLTATLNTWYDACLANNGGSPDIFFDTAVFNQTPCAQHRPNAITDTKVRRLGSILLDGSVHILAFFTFGDWVFWKVSVVDVNGAAQSATAASKQLPSIPPGVPVMWRGIVSNLSGAAGHFVWVYPTSMTDEVASNTEGISTTSAANGFPVQADVLADTNQSVRVVADSATGTYSLRTLAYMDYRGKQN